MILSLDTRKTICTSLIVLVDSCLLPKLVVCEHFGFGCVEEDTNQEQGELVVICYFVGTQTRLKEVARYVLIKSKLVFLSNILILFIFLIFFFCGFGLS